MKRFITNILIFFLVVATVDFCYGIAFDYMKAQAKGGEIRKLYDICQEKEYDIIILGSSRAHHHYNTSILADSTGMTCFNAGFDGNGVILSYGILKLILERYNPKLIIYDVEPAFDIERYTPDNNCTRYLKFLKPFYKDSSIKKIFEEISINDYYKLYSGIVRHNSDCLITLSSCFSKFNEDPRNGYSPLKGLMTEDAIIQTPEVTNIDSRKVEYFRKLLITAKEANIPVVVIYSPKYEFTNKETLETINNICNESSVPLWDYSAQRDFLKPYYFKEPMHLNADGSNLFSMEIGGKIRSVLFN